jgi:hypothetical protein
MTAGRDLTPYCAAASCDLNLAGWPHVPWDCDTPLPAPTLDASTVARLPAWRRPWVQGSARAFARLNPALAGRAPEPGEELPGELACDPRERQRLREQEATATLGERAEAGLRAENAPPDPARRRVVIAERAEFARLHALDRHLLLDSVARLPAGTPDLSQRSALDTRFHAFLLSDHPAAVAERCRRRAAYLDDTARERELLLGWLGKLDAIPPRPGDPFDDRVSGLAVTTRRLLHQQAARLAEEVGEPDSVRVARQRQQYGRYPTRWIGPAAARQPIPPKRPSPATRAGATRHQRQGRDGRPGKEAGYER